MQFTYFPYLTLLDREEISFGDIKVWKFDTNYQKYIKDIQLQKIVKELIESNVSNNKPIEGMAVISIGDTDFRELSQEEFQIVNEVRLILFLSFLSRTNVNVSGPNAGHYLATSENFTFTVQNFDPNSESIAQQNGFIVKKTDGGWKRGDLLFHAPPFIPKPLKFNIDDDIINKLLRIKKNNKRVYERILRATDFMFESYFNDPYVSINARLLLQVDSFEVLLNLPETKQREKLKELIKKYAVRQGEKKRSYLSERGLNKKTKEIESIKVKWADRFYVLRNHIIHGTKVKIDEFYFIKKQSHLDIAPKFFVLLTKEIINEKLKLRYFRDNIQWNTYEDSNGDIRKGFVYDDGTLQRKLSKKYRR